MKNVTWRELVEVVGVLSIVASLIFVGLELRQAQQIAVIDSSATRAGWFFANRASIKEHADVWHKGNSGSDLTPAEQIIFSNLVRDIHTNNRFTWSRERRLGDDGQDYAAHELTWILYQNPAARNEWERYIRNNEAMRRTLMPTRYASSGSFTNIVSADLEKLDRMDAASSST